LALLGTVGTAPALTLDEVSEAGLFQTQAKVLRLWIHEVSYTKVESPLPQSATAA